MGKDLISAIEQVSREKGIDPSYLIEAIEEAVLQAAQRILRQRNKLRIHLDSKEGNINLWILKKIVDRVHDPSLEISLDDALLIDPKATLGNDIEVPYPREILDRLKTVQIAKKVILTKVKEAQRERILKDYKKQMGRILTGTVKAVWRGDVLLELPDSEALLPREFQLPRDRFERNQYVRALLVRASLDEDPPLVVSRVHPDFIYRLLEMEIEEVFSGIVQVVRILREPGERAKVAVRSNDPNVDAVGSCVGIKGSRINAVMNELHGERIDVIQWSDDVCVLAANALKPARVIEVHMLDQSEKVLEAVVADDQLSIAIGKGGQNVKLASRLVGWRIEVIRASEKEGHFAPTHAATAFYEYLVKELHIPDEMIQRLMENGYDRMLPLIRASVSDLIEAASVDHETAKLIKEALRDFTRGRHRISSVEKPKIPAVNAVDEGVET